MRPLPFILLAAVRSARGFECVRSTSHSLAIRWAADPSADAFYVALSDEDSPAERFRPFALTKSTSNAVVLDDLRPNRTYHMRLRAHPATEPSLVWGWKNYSHSISCRTRASPSAPALRRVGSSPQPRSIRVAWSAVAAAGEYHVRYAAEWDGLSDSLVTFQALVTRDTAVTITGLESDSTYWVQVCPASTSCSDPLRMKTASLSAVRKVMYRVSEYTADVDFLENHNAGDALGETAFLGDSGNFAPEDLLRNTSNTCLQALARTDCANPGGSAESCLTCVVGAWDRALTPAETAVRSQCSNPSLAFPEDNKLVEAFCGSWSGFFSFETTPIAEYCVEHVALQHAVDYASCNAPEAGTLNTPADPICICEVFADRMIGQQTPSQTKALCGIVLDDSVYPACNCTNNSVLLPASAPSRQLIGEAAVYCPYYYYSVPQEEYVGSTRCGSWYSLPRAGVCPGHTCSWSYEPTVRMVYGTELLSHGWDASLSFDQLTGKRRNTTDQTLQNLKAFGGAFTGNQSRVSANLLSRCCGC
jgi:hypothetical protein